MGHLIVADELDLNFEINNGQLIIFIFLGVVLLELDHLTEAIGHLPGLLHGPYVIFLNLFDAQMHITYKS